MGWSWIALQLLSVVTGNPLYPFLSTQSPFATDPETCARQR